MASLGLYVSIPFCRAKCSFCNFASDAFVPGLLPGYIDRLLKEIASARSSAASLGAELPQVVDTLYFGGGTPSLLSCRDVRRLFATLREHFSISSDAEITVECAPGQLTAATLEELQRNGVNRLSFGVQSFIDAEGAAIGRLHTAKDCFAEFDRVRSAGILNLSLDLIAGLPRQNEASWRESVAQATSSGVPHVSVYMLEIDEDSRLGREVLAGGSRYSAPAVPTDDQAVFFYELACDLLASAGITQYEISNFARPGFRSAHNLKYWTRQPYLGLGLDAHSMLRTSRGEVRFANTDDLEQYLQVGREASPLLPYLTGKPRVAERVDRHQAFEEALFLGLRLNDGVSLEHLQRSFGEGLLQHIRSSLEGLEADQLLTARDQTLRLTARGRTLSNEVFSRLLIPTLT